MIFGIAKTIQGFNDKFNKDSEALSNKLFRAVAQREKVDPVPIEKLVYLPMNQRKQKLEKDDAKTQTAEGKEETDENMVTVEKY